jgi:Na+-driven multidrug efflux pump
VTFLVIFLSMLLRGAGDARTPMVYTFVWIVLGMAIGPILLTGAFGAPKLGVIGMAIGGLISGIIALFGLIGAVYRSGSPLALRGQQLRYLKPDPAVLASLASRGAPMAAETMIVQGAYFVLLAMVNAYGAPTASAYAAAAQLWGYVQMPAIALAASMSSMAAINIGAGQWPRVELLARQGVMLSMLMTTATTLIVYALGDAPLKLFLPAGGEALAIARHINFIALWGWIVLAVTSGLSAIVRANGAMAPPAIIFFITMWVMRVPFAAFLQPVLGADAIWWSFPLGSVASAALAYAYFRYGGWRKRQRLLPASARPS